MIGFRHATRRSHADLREYLAYNRLLLPADCGGKRNLSAYCGSGARAGTDTKVPSDEVDSLPHTDEAKPRLITIEIRPEPDAIIPNYEYEVSTVSCQAHINGLRLAMLGYVMKSFLRHTKKGQG